MKEWQRTTTAMQLAAHLLEELKKGRWQGKMPGVMRLSKELGVARDSVEAAMLELESQGILRSQGPGRGRIINLDDSTSEQRGLKVSILLGDNGDRHGELLLDILTALQKAGYDASFASKTQDDLGNKVQRIAQFVNETAADAWVIYSAPQDVLKWFERSKKPCFALAGRANRVRIPSIAPDKITPLRFAIKRLVELGHRRIIMLTSEFRRIPEPGLFERAFLDELETQGIPTGLYNLPDWKEDTEGFQKNLDSLFRFTPPTALVIDKALYILPTLQFCMKNGLQIPKDFSLICAESDPSFKFSQPSVAHIQRNTRPISGRIVQWTENVEQGKEDFQKGFSEAEFIEGETVGPAQE